MKKLYFIAILSLIVFPVFSQTLQCGEDDQELFNHFYTIPANSNYTNSTYDATTKHVFNVRFHVIYNDDGVTRTNNLGDPGIPIGFNEVMNAIRDLNVNFNQFNIFFKYWGYDQINETDYLNLETLEELNQLRTNYSTPDAINIFILNGAAWGAPSRSGFLDDDWFIRPWTQVHEMGHNFGLSHVYAANNGICEHATRVPGPNFNATTAGDWILDTLPVGNADNTYFNSNCDYTGGAIGCYNEPIQATTLTNGYFISGPPFYNFLNAEEVNSACSPIFTPGQGVKMRENIVGFWAAQYNAHRNTVESLYQPFEEMAFGGNTVISVDDLGDGTAEVCRNLKVRHRFQKGFTYVFPDNDGNPDLINFGVDDIPENVNHDFNYNLIINQIDPVTEGEVLICSRGQFCITEPFVSGDDLVTDFLGSYNFSMQHWDHLQVADPNLYNQLERNKYHIIKKYTESGYVFEVTLYRP